MTMLLAVVVGSLYAAGIYLMMDRNMIRLILGLALLSHAANLLIFSSAGLSRGQPPIIGPDGSLPPGTYADPLPQALILTAIVISFGVLAFAMALVYRCHETVGSEDLDVLRKPE